MHKLYLIGRDNEVNKRHLNEKLIYGYEKEKNDFLTEIIFKTMNERIFELLIYNS